MSGFKTNIQKETLKNKYFRKVLFTGKKMQLVVMTLKAGEDIPFEVHHSTDQFIRVESGQATAYLGNKVFHLKNDDVIIIPTGTRHRIVNSSPSKYLKLYTIYALPEHKPGTIHKTRADALKHHH